MTPSSHRFRRVLIGLGLLLACWAAGIAWTGGFYLRLGDMRLSSRSPWAPLEVAALLEGLAAALISRTDGLKGLAAEWRWWAGWANELARRFGPVAPAVAVVVVVALAEVQQWLASPPLWLDEETISLNIRDRSFAGLAGPLWLGQSAPLGWLWLMRAAVRTLGTSEIALRLVPTLFAIAMLAVVVWIGARWLGLLAALILAWLCGFSPWLWHYAFEVKHYTADAWSALLLPALGVWVLEGARPADRWRRLLAWWGVASASLWVANGAMLATPAIAIYVTLVLWRLDGMRAAARASAVSGLWFLSFGAHYVWSARYTLASPYLHDFWASKLPPPSLGVLDRVIWAWRQLPLLAWNPAGTPLWITLWVCAVSGYVLAPRRRLGVAYALVPISAFAFGIVGVVPLADRVALWIVPALYVGVALLVDRAARLGATSVRQRRWLGLVAATVACGLAIHLSADLFARSEHDLLFFGTLTDKQRLDDRSAVRWLVGREHPGDAVLTTHLAWPALWWYGPMSLADPMVAQGALHDGTGLFEVDYAPRGPDCHPNALRAALAGRRRALLYLGFRDVPEGYDNFVVDRLADLGTIVELRKFAGLSVSVVVDLTAVRPDESLRDRPSPVMAGDQPLDGCVGVRRAVRW